ncbi:M24 family metallopeptidase [Chelativorans sp. ZYF759]|nr:aminopeptidase P family protein [Chelativorans sp. ZYF759]NMG41509.1 M24 family metallopeptidase [Chelativorans sp. ZYF759]
MFQTFDVQTDPSHAAPRIARLRQAMLQAGVDAFLVPRADEHQGEYVPARAERLKWLTGFTGSAGMALIMTDRAILFVDGRYTLQARTQCDVELFEIGDLVGNPPVKWLEAHARKGWRVGIDPWLHTIAEVRKLEKAATKQGATLVPLHENLVDRIWQDQPAAPLGRVDVHPDCLAGQSVAEKLAALAGAIETAGASHCVLTDPSSLAWAFNIRGCDVEHTPLALGFAILAVDGAHRLFLDPAKLSAESRAHLENHAKLSAPDDLAPALVELCSHAAAIGLDPALAADRLRGLIEEAGGSVVEMADPAQLPRATKNATEIEGARRAHLRDGVAVTRFLRWLDLQEPGSIDEIGAATRLEDCRRAAGEAFQEPLREIAFDTISGAGPNGAIIHYRVTTGTNRALGAGELYLVDSGGQYRDGTTDITRTVAIGKPSAEMRARYTTVLKGLIAISTLRFPEGTRGRDIDAFARRAHWQAGIDYAHGTGHGVGSFLSVHEGPQRISRMGEHKLLPGMIVSNEPGYYKEGAYGIRLENLIVVEEAREIEGGDTAMHGFETLTLAPFDRRLIDPAMLDGWERNWLDAYHARVLDVLSPHIDPDERQWLEKAAAPLAD